MREETSYNRNEELIELGRSAAEVAHELRNFLTPILSNAELLANSKHPEVKESAQRILANADRCRSFVNHILGGLRGQASTFETIDLAKVVSQYIQKRDSKAAIELDIPKDVSFLIRGEDYRLISLFENLIRNAEEASKSADLRVKITFATAGTTQAVVTVEDDGPGIPQEIAQTIFEAFTTKDKTEGTGIGLALCSQVADDHGGQLSLVAKGSKGATFELRLPLLQSDPGLDDLDEGKTKELPALKILCIDDDQSTIDTYRMILKLDYHQVTSALTAKDALSLFEKDSFDVILCDFRLPDMNGVAFFDVLQNSKPEQANKVVFVTGDLMNPESQAKLKSTSRPFLIKPFTIEELRVAIQVALNQKDS